MLLLGPHALSSWVQDLPHLGNHNLHRSASVGDSPCYNSSLSLSISFQTHHSSSLQSEHCLHVIPAVPPDGSQEKAVALMELGFGGSVELHLLQSSDEPRRV